MKHYQQRHQHNHQHRHHRKQPQHHMSICASTFMFIVVVVEVLLVVVLTYLHLHLHIRICLHIVVPLSSCASLEFPNAFVLIKINQSLSSRKYIWNNRKTMKKTVWTLFDKCHIEFEKLSDHNNELPNSFSISILLQNQCHLMI